MVPELLGCGHGAAADQCSVVEGLRAPTFADRSIVALQLLIEFDLMYRLQKLLETQGREH